MKYFGCVLTTGSSGDYTAQFKKIEDCNCFWVFFDSMKELTGCLKSRIFIEDMEYGKEVRVNSNHKGNYLRTASIISSMLVVPNVFLIAASILSESSFISLNEPFFLKSPLRYNSMVFLILSRGDRVTSNSLPAFFATSSGTDKCPSESTLPMNLYILAACIVIFLGYVRLFVKLNFSEKYKNYKQSSVKCRRGIC